MSILSNPALYGAVMFHGAAMLPRLRALPFETLKKIGDELSEHNCENPLWMQPFASDKRFDAPSWGDEKLSGCQVIALMVFTLWVAVGEKEEMASSLCETWPIREAVIMAGTRQANPAQP